MKRQNVIRVFAGTMILLTAGLAYFHSPYWLIGTALVGLNLFQYGFTDWCLLDKILKKMKIEE